MPASAMMLALSGCGLLTDMYLNQFIEDTRYTKTYKLKKHTKRGINLAIKKLYVKYPAYRPAASDSFYQNTIHFPKCAPEERRAANADSVQFHFEIMTADSTKIIYWAGFEGLQTNWDFYYSTTHLILYGYWEHGHYTDIEDTSLNTKK